MAVLCSTKLAQTRHFPAGPAGLLFSVQAASHYVSAKNVPLPQREILSLQFRRREEMIIIPSDSRPRRQRRRVVLLAGLIVPLVLAGAAIGMSFMFFGCIAAELEESNVSGPAPNASYAMRRAWGEENLRHHFLRVDDWIRQSKQIADDIGTVTGVAPVGAPNSYGASFGESWARMNLQVIGEKGEGILYLPDVCADDTRKLHGVTLNDQSWTFKRSAEADAEQ